MKNKLQYFLLSFCFITITTFSWAHTSYPKEIKCPIDDETFTIYVTGSYTTFGTFKDFQKHGAIGDLYESQVNSCPKCHYAGYKSDFDTTFTPVVKKDILKILAPYKRVTINDVIENEIAIETCKYFKTSNDKIANLYLVASYFLKEDSTQIQKRKELQKNCSKYLLEAVKKKEYDEKATYATIHYLIGELYRRIGQFDRAIKHFDLALKDKNKKSWVGKITLEQKALARKEDERNDI